MKKKQLETLLYSVAGVIAMGLIIVAANVIFGVAKQRVDLTHEKLYTLSDGTKTILKKLDAPVEIRFYCTQGEKEMPSQFKVYSQHIDDLLSEYKQYGKSNIKIKRLNPKPDSDAEDSAKLDGVEGQMLSNGESLYMGIAISSLDEKVAIPFLSPDRERLLEYDITRAISRVASPQKPVVGVMTSLPMFGQPMNPMMAMRGQQPPQQEKWIVISELERDFTVKQIQMDVDKIDDDVKVLMVVHPKDISDKAQYAIDQFIMRGGKMVAFLDGNCVIDSRNAQQNPMMGMMGGGGSSMDKLLKAWGITFDSSKVVADANFTSRFMRQGRPEAAPAVLSMNASGIEKDDVVTSQIDSLLLPFAGAFTGTPVAGLKETVLLKSTADSQLVEGIMATMSGEQISKDFKASGTKYALAIRLAGKFKTAFPDGKPQEKDDKKDGDKKEEKKSADDSLKESKDTAVILVGDSDMLYDQFSVSVQNFLGQKIIQPRNGNLNFVQGMIEQMSGDSSLIAVRSRATLNRPFTVVQNMQAKAEDAYRARIKQLEEGLQETQRKINELQAKKEKGQRFVLSPEQQKEIEKFRKDENEAKKELKRVRKDLRQDIDSLENEVKWINIAGMPIIVAAFGIGLALFRGQRAKSK